MAAGPLPDGHAVQTRPSALLCICACFSLVGVMTTLSGVLVPWLAARYSMPASTLAWLFPAQFCCGAAGVISSGVIIRRWGLRAALALGYALLAAGAALFAPAAWPGMLAGVCLYGMGVGLVNPSSNLAAGTLSRRGPVMVNALNFCWGTEAVAGPAVLPLLLARYGAAAIARILAPLSAAALVGMLLAVPRGPAGGGRAGCQRDFTGAILSGATLFFYVGTETTIAGWTPLYAMRSLGVNVREAGLALSLIWGSLLAGRASGPFLVSRAGIDRMLRANLALLAAGISIIALAPSLPVLMLGCVVSGLGLATIFPNVVAAYTVSGGRNLPVVFLMASGGGATLPWVAGRLVSATGHPLAALAPAAVACIMMAATWAKLRRRWAGNV